MIKFGPSGNSLAFSLAGYKNSEDSASWVKNMGLSCFEYSFGRGVSMGDEKAVSIGQAFGAADVEISVHAPYYINFSNPEDENAEKSYQYVISSAEKVKLMRGKRVVFHPASQGKMTREKAVELCAERLKKLRDIIYEKGLDNLIYCPETMGKIGQIGTIEEVVSFCKIDKIYTPAVDFGHINARECGSLKSEKDFVDRLKFMIDELGFERMKHFHVHFSKIEYSAKGEVRHLTFEDDHYGPNPEHFIYAVKKLGLEPYVICESAGTQDVDALNMQKTYYGN